MRTRALSFALSLAALGCSGTGQPGIEYEAFATPRALATVQAGEWSVTLDEAVVAFGPVYFCAAASGSATLCETAIGEIRAVTAIDALDPAPRPLGTVRGLAGTIRSASYDFGVHWFLTEKMPRSAPEAPGGHSAHLAGTAVKGDVTLRFVADVDVIPQFQGQRAVPTVPASAVLEAGEEGARVDMTLDAAAWIAHVDFDEAMGQDPYRIEAGSTNYGALVIAMTAQQPPAFTWTRGEVNE